MARGDVTPYTTTVEMSGSLPQWINEYDRQRYASYNVFDDMYKNISGTYALVTRGSENKPVLVPTPRMIIKTLSRYTAVRPTLDIKGPNDAAVIMARAHFDNLFKRERFWSKFSSNKMLGMRRGDWLWHIVANPLKLQGSRISIYAVDPRNYFKILDPADVDRTVGCHIIEQIVEGDKTLIKKQTYTKGPDPIKAPLNNDGLIYSSLTIWELDQWEDPTKAPLRTISPPTPLPPQITQLPVYHIPHNEEVGDPYGVSDLQGLEQVISEIIQSVSDESVSLALEGIGMYATTSGPPRDEVTGAIAPWRLGPGRVVEHPDGTDFKRVDGIGSVAPYQDHMNWLVENGIKQPTGLTDVAIGRVDAQIAESGVALALQLAPTLSETDRNDVTIKEIHNQMFFDLVNWLNAYELAGIDPGVSVALVFGDKIPTNRKEKIAELDSMFDKGIIDSEFYRIEMGKFGYIFPADMGLAVASERAQMVAAMVDPEVSRMNQELATPVDDQVTPSV